MARRGKVARDAHRRRVVARYAERRAELKELLRRPGTPVDAREAAARELSRQPRDASATRVRNRDAVDGRPRGHLRKFGLSRLRLRAQAHAGFLPGVRKASW
ncbi:30S ribosomal protein S14 [Streptomyces sp. Qhu_M48]|uniref:30S ribosomal protein S14 n=1 Tax=Streptomyces sp. Qhu_M48 TaxID=3435889 RepID=UPI003F4F5208